MRTSTLITLLVVGGSGVAAFILAYGYLGSQPDPNKGKVPILCAVNPVKRGDTLELGKNVEFKLYSPENIPEDALTQEEKLVVDLQNRRVVSFAAINRNELLKKTMAGTDRDSLIEQKLKDRPNYRAYTIQVSTDRAVAGFIKPGASVDLIWTGNVKNKNSVTRSLLRNVEVAAVDLDNTAGTDQKGREVRYITFIVEKKHDLLLAFAQKNGDISASLVGAGGSVASDKDVNQIDWAGFEGYLDGAGGGGPGGQALGADDRKSMETDGLSLLNVVDAALNAPKGEIAPAPGNRTPVKTVASTMTAQNIWYIFEVKSIDGKTVSAVPISSESEFAKRNRAMLRSPEPDELEAINKMPRDTVPGGQGG